MSIVEFFKDPIGGIRELVLNYGIRTVFERLPILSNLLSYLNGHKETLGKVLTFVGAVLVLAKQTFPELAFSLDESQIAFFIGVLMDLLGKAHAYDKERRGIGRNVRIAYKKPNKAKAQS